jgi:hypothetical protein
VGQQIGLPAKAGIVGERGIDHRAQPSVQGIARCADDDVAVSGRVCLQGRRDSDGGAHPLRDLARHQIRGHPVAEETLGDVAHRDDELCALPLAMQGGGDAEPRSTIR